MFIKQITFPSLRHRTTFPGIKWDFFPFFMSLSSTRDPFFPQHSQLLNEDHTSSINANLLIFSFDLKEWKRRRWRNSMHRDCGHGPFHQPSSWTPIVDITFFSFFFLCKFIVRCNCKQNPSDVYK